MQSRLRTDATRPLHRPPTAAAMTTPSRENEIAPSSLPGCRTRPRPVATAGASRAVPTDRTFEDLRSFPSTVTRSTLRLGYGFFTPWGDAFTRRLRTRAHALCVSTHLRPETPEATRTEPVPQAPPAAGRRATRP